MNKSFTDIAKAVERNDASAMVDLLAIANPNNKFGERLNFSSIIFDRHTKKSEVHDPIAVENGIYTEVKNGVCTDVANGTYANTGYQVPMDTLTALSKDLIEAKAIVDSDEFNSVIPTQTNVSPYLPTVLYQLMGVTGGTIYDYEVSSNHNGAIKGLSTEGKSFTTERKLYAFSLSSNIIADRQQSAAGFAISDYATKLRLTIKQAKTFAQTHRALGIKKGPDFFTGGLLTPNPVYDRPVDHSLLTKPIQDMSPTELMTFLKDALQDYFETCRSTADTIILPDTAIPALSVLYKDITGMPATTLDVLGVVLTSANKGKPVKILGSQYFAADHNGKNFNFNDGKGEDFVVIANSEEAEMFFDEPVPMQLLSTTSAGLYTTSILLMQLGETVMRRPEFVAVHSYIRP
jgi:hypothetical protein